MLSRAAYDGPRGDYRRVNGGYEPDRPRPEEGVVPRLRDRYYRSAAGTTNELNGTSVTFNDPLWSEITGSFCDARGRLESHVRKGVVCVHRGYV